MLIRKLNKKKDEQEKYVHILSQGRTRPNGKTAAPCSRSGCSSSDNVTLAAIWCVRDRWWMARVMLLVLAGVWQRRLRLRLLVLFEFYNLREE